MTKAQLIAENNELRMEIDVLNVRIHNDALRLKKAKSGKK